MIYDLVSITLTKYSARRRGAQHKKFYKKFQETTFFKKIHEAESFKKKETACL